MCLLMTNTAFTTLRFKMVLYINHIVITYYNKGKVLITTNLDTSISNHYTIKQMKFRSVPI